MLYLAVTPSSAYALKAAPPGRRASDYFRGQPMHESPCGRTYPNLFNEQVFLDRRAFLGALAATSAALLCGAPGFARAEWVRQDSLQQQVMDLVQRLKGEGLIGANERTAWSVYDFSAGKKLVAINEDSPRQAASMIKPLVAQAFFFQVKNSRGRIAYTEDIRATMERSIRRSSNPATNALIELVSRNQSQRGPKDVEAVLKTNAPQIFQQTRVVEKIPANGRTFRNTASAADYSRFLIALWQDRLPYSRELRSLMALPNHDRICQGVDSMPSTVRVYDKTGSTSQLCGDMGIIEAQTLWGRSVPYVFVGIIERPTSAKNYGTWITRRSNAIRAVSNLVYLEMKERYRLA
jgi:beta-lactamase class A